MLREFWSELTGTIHPADNALLTSEPHSFNLDYPPPAFVGEPNAPIVMLMANGGYKSDVTPNEFQDEAAAEKYRNGLRGLSSSVPECYNNRGFGQWAREGKVVLVNAVAYRSENLSTEPENQRISSRLPSFLLHKRWVTEEVIPQAQAGRRFLIVHRNGAWRLNRALACETIIFSPNPRSPYPAKSVSSAAGSWLERQCKT